MAYIQTGGSQIFFTDEGNGPPVVLVHGSGCDSYDWNYQLPALLPRFRVIAVDRRGHGHSGAPEAGYGPRSEVPDLITLLDSLAIERVIAIGHSTGAGIVAALAADYPARVRALVAVDPSYGVDPAARPRLEAACTGLDGPESHAVFRAMIGAFYTTSSPAHLRPWHQRRVETVPAHVLAAVTRETVLSPSQFFFSPESEALLSRISCPILTVRRAGVTAKAEVDRGQFGNGHSVSHEWADCGHWPHQERPAEFNALLMDWLETLPT